MGQYFQYDDEEKSKAELEGMVRLWQQVVSPNKERLHGKPLSAGYAAALFGLAFEWCGDFEEELLLLRMGVDPADEEKPPHIGPESTATTTAEGHPPGTGGRRLGSARRCRAQEDGPTAAVQPEEARSRRASRAKPCRAAPPVALPAPPPPPVGYTVKGEKATGATG